MATAAPAERRQFVTLGMFIIDEFAYLDEEGNPTGKTLPPPQVCLHFKFIFASGAGYF